MNALTYLLVFLSLSLSSCSLPGGSEWIWIFIAILLLFGGRKIPELMRGIGKGIRELNDAKDGIKKEFEEGMSEKDKRAYRQASEERAYSQPKQIEEEVVEIKPAKAPVKKSAPIKKATAVVKKKTPLAQKKSSLRPVKKTAPAAKSSRKK